MKERANDSISRPETLPLDPRPFTIGNTTGDSRPRILIVSACFDAIGGGNACTAAAIDQLKHEYRVTLASMADPEFDRIEKVYGIAISLDEIEVLQPPRPLRALVGWICRLDPDPASIWDWAVLMRFLRRHRDRFDAILSFNDETDLGIPILQYVHYPWLSIHRLEGPRRPWQWAAGFRFDRISGNRTLVNSKWTGERFEAIHGGQAHVVAPPVSPPRERSGGAPREEAFLSIGRIAPEKRTILMIDILERVRARGHDVKLRIAGPVYRTAYASALEARARDEGSWVEILGEVPRERLDELRQSHRYGIHAMLDEHFGIGVAELMSAGCIPFAHASGGQEEILDGIPDLLYEDEDDAVEKIVAMLENERLREATLARLASRAKNYTPECFGSALRRHIDVFIEEARKREGSAG